MLLRVEVRAVNQHFPVGDGISHPERFGLLMPRKTRNWLSFENLIVKSSFRLFYAIVANFVPECFIVDLRLFQPASRLLTLCQLLCVDIHLVSPLIRLVDSFNEILRVDDRVTELIICFDFHGRKSSDSRTFRSLVQLVLCRVKNRIGFT